MVGLWCDGPAESGRVMTDQRSDMPLPETRGAVFRIFGAILVILGTLDIMLSWRGGVEVFSFHVLLFATGVVLCVIGAIRRQGQS
jgi:hypothetical protein